MTACKPTKVDSFNSNSIEVIKFMATYYDYPIDIYYDSFWEFQEEHAKLSIIHDFSLEDRFNELPIMKEDETFEFLTYAFIYKNGSKNDTIYADQTLKAFKKYDSSKSKYKETLFYDEKGEIARALRERFSFFRECW